jgi:hypothetical membrane protein
MSAQQQTGLSETARSDRRKAIATLGAVAGLIGPLIFTVGFVIQGLLRPGEYDPIAEPVSALEAGPNGWIQQLNFIVFGLLMLIFAAGLRSGVRHTRSRILGPAVVAWWGTGLVVAGVFPLQEDAQGQTYDATGLHESNGALFFLSTWVGLALLSWWLRTDPHWRSLARYSAITAAVLMPLFFAMAFLVVPESAPLHPWWGLGQRVLLAVWFPCLIVLAVRLWQVARLEWPALDQAETGEDRWTRVSLS